MKTTNYLISKQLAEAGFKAKTNWVWAWSGDEHQLCCYNNTTDEAEKRDFLSYDLETILEALPNQIEIGRCCPATYKLEKNITGYWHNIEYEIYVEKEENESLADTAAKLWLSLRKKI